MIRLFSALYKLFSSFFPIIEISFLSFYLGLAFGSLPLGVILFIILTATSYFLGIWSRVVAWSVFGYLLYYNDLDAGILKALLVAIILGVGRFALKKLVKV